MSGLKKIAALVLLLLASVAAHADEYQGFLERGEFFLNKGAAYIPDAVRAFEQAAETDAARAALDVRYVANVAKAYLGANRYTEAYLWIQRLEKTGNSDVKVDSLKDYLLKEAGVGRLRLVPAFPVQGFTGSFRVSEDGIKLDVSGRKVLEKLNQFLSVPQTLPREGLILLVPEGRLVFDASYPLGGEGVYQKIIEMWSGDEVEQHVVASFPQRDEWRVSQGNGAVTLGWPEGPKGAKFKVSRALQGGQAAILCEGVETTCSDVGATPGVPVDYILYTYGQDGLLLSISSITATSLPPVSAVAATLQLSPELNLELDWRLGAGSVSRLVLKKTDHSGEKTILDQRGEEIMRSGGIVDGPLPVLSASQTVSYTFEAYAGGDAPTALSTVTAVVPPEIARMETVRERFDGDRVYVEWDTYPKDGLAESYEIYLMREPNGMGELVGRVKDAFAREYSYVPRNGAPTAQWRHIVLPYVGKRMLVEPVPIHASDVIPQMDLDRRMRKLKKPPNLVLSWDPYRGATTYFVQIGEKKEFMVRDTYVELTGLQSNVVDSDNLVRVYAPLNDGTKLLLLEMQLNYKRYSSEDKPEAEK